MDDYIKHYKIELTTVSPVFIGDGNKLKKKDYIENNNEVYVIDYMKMYEYIQKRKLYDQYEEYIFNFNDKRGLFEWVKKNNIGESTYKKWKKYQVHLNGKISNNDIMTFVKDPYGKPYIPGSSLKGVIRTALLIYELNDREIIINTKKYINNSISDCKDSKKNKNRNRFLEKEIEVIENIVFNDASSGFREDKFNDICRFKNKEDFFKFYGKDDKDKQSIMSGIIVSDSKPIDIKHLTLSQKIDCDIHGNKNMISVYRESIEPNVKIEFDLTIDSKQTRYTIMDIKKAIKLAMDIKNKYFYSKFNESISPANSKDLFICIGGGVGYQDKTITHSVYKKDSTKVVSKIFEHTIQEKRSKNGIDRKTYHREDVEEGVSPRVCKKTTFRNKELNMGVCKIEIISKKTSLK